MSFRIKQLVKDSKQKAISSLFKGSACCAKSKKTAQISKQQAKERGGWGATSAVLARANTYLIKRDDTLIWITAQNEVTWQGRVMHSMDTDPNH